MKNINSIKTWISKHKIFSSIIAITFAIICYAVIWGFGGNSQETRYVLANVERGTIVSSVSGTGQVSASNQIDLKPRASGNTNVSGNITYIAVKASQKVRQGQLLFSLDDRDARKTVRNAETSLETAQLALDKFKQAPKNADVLTIKQAIANAETSRTDAEKAVTDAYRNLLNTSTAASSSNSSDTQTPPMIIGTYTKDQEATIVINIYQTGNGAYFSASSVPAGIVSGAGEVTTAVSQPIGDSGLYIKFATTSPSGQSWIINLPNKSVTAYDANYIAYQNALENQKRVKDVADLTVAQNNQKLIDLLEPDALDLRAKQLAVDQAQNTLNDAKQALQDYSVTAPFSGVISTVPVQEGELVTSNTVLATLITEKQFAEISLNEVDVAKIKIGQKVTLTFDAIPDLSMSGKVAEIDSTGMVSQGVVTYIVKVSFDTQDNRIKPAMSVSAAIITDIKQDVLVVPNSAVKSQNGSSYVEKFNTPLTPPTDGGVGSISKIIPNKIPVEVGIANDSQSEIISGLKEGDEIITRTILPTTAKTTTAPSIFGSPATGNRGSGGGGFQAR